MHPLSRRFGGVAGPSSGWGPALTGVIGQRRTGGPTPLVQNASRRGPLPPDREQRTSRWAETTAEVVYGLNRRASFPSRRPAEPSVRRFRSFDAAMTKRGAPGTLTSDGDSVSSTELRALTDDELRARASAAGIAHGAGMRRDDLIAALQDTDQVMTRSEERLVASTQVYETSRGRLRTYGSIGDLQITR